MRFKLFIFLLLGFLALPAFATDKADRNDSLLAKLTSTTDINERFLIYEKLFRANRESAIEKAKSYIDEMAVLDKKINTPFSHVKLEFANALKVESYGEDEPIIKKLEAVIPKLKAQNLEDDLAEAYGYLGHINTDLGNYNKAIEQLSASDSFAISKKNIRLQCENLMYLGRCYEQMGDDTKAIKILQQSLALAEQLKDRRLRSQVLLIIGSVYSEGSNQDFSLRYLNEADKIATEDNDTSMLINIYTYKANSYYYTKQYKEALKIYENLKALSGRIGNKTIYAGTLGNIGNVYAAMGEDQKALNYQNEAAKLFEEVGDKEGMTICYSSIGSSYFELKDYDRSIEFYKKGLALAEAMQTPEDLIEIHLGLSKVYEATGNYRDAYENYKVYNQFNDSLFNEGNTKKLTELELNYQFENKQKEISLQHALDEERFKRFIYLAISGILLLLIVVTLVYRNNRQRKKANDLLQLSNKEILLQKEELEQKSTIIEMAYNDIKSSINYAKRIQEAILPVKEEIRKAFFESFVLFKPRDVVSGDFYWFTKHENKKIIACVDCTGHGVPGAFMSMIGNTLLNEIVNEKGITKPSDILDLLHIRVRQSLKQNLENTETRDGMDIAICVVHENGDILQYAGANRPLYIIRDNNLEEIKPNKMSIGGDQMEEDRNFSNHEIEIKKQDVIYMSTDGYADQFGGEKGKKFMVKRFHQTILEIQHLSMAEQGGKLKSTIEEWQDNQEQVDDILVIGIRI